MSEQMMEFTRETVEALGAPFPEDEIEFLPRAQSGGKALGLPYIDARSVMRRRRPPPIWVLVCCIRISPPSVGGRTANLSASTPARPS